MKVLYISNILWKFHSYMLNRSGNTVMNLYTLNIQESLKHAWHWGLVFWDAWQQKC